MVSVVRDVEIKGAYKKFGPNTVLDGIDLDVRQGELLTLLGPSGCGKTTTLNLIAGFLEADQGELYIKGTRMNGVPSYKRDLGMVFQTYSLFPHMTVYENLVFGLDLRKVSKSEKKRRVQRALELVKMTGLEKRYPREMSGGQRQRVAIARALVVEPTLLLLDEPLSNLDAKLRHELRAEIKRLQKEVGVTTIFVTHDQDEALSLSDRIVIMNNGKIEQAGTPTAIYENPQTEFVFNFIGKSNRLQGKVEATGQTVDVNIGDGYVTSVENKSFDGTSLHLAKGDGVQLYIRPEKLSLVPYDANSGLAKARIVQMHFFGTYWEVEVALGEQTLIVLAPSLNSEWTPGNEVNVSWHKSDMKLAQS